jgi:hypothetical protein
MTKLLIEISAVDYLRNSEEKQSLCGAERQSGDSGCFKPGIGDLLEIIFQKAPDAVRLDVGEP